MNPRTALKNRFVARLRELPSAACALVLTCLCASQGLGQTYTVLHRFAGAFDDGETPSAGLILAGNTLYGTTQGGGPHFDGTVFRVNTDGTGYALLHTFEVVWIGGPIYTNADGAYPCARLVSAGSWLYGTACSCGPRGRGTVFKVSTNGTEFIVLKSFGGADGAFPTTGLVLSGTTLYGTTEAGGSNDSGTVYKINTDGSGFVVLKQFPELEGRCPSSGLAISGTNLYGTTRYGGTNGFGTVFRLNTDGSGFAVLKQFEGNDGGNTTSGHLVDEDTLYGGTIGGPSPYSEGLLFKMNVDGSGYTVIKTFTNIPGQVTFPGTPALVGRKLYGTTFLGGTANQGTVFQINTDGSGYATLKEFNGGADGAYPQEGLGITGAVPVVSDGRLYGTTSAGGFSDHGVVFSLTLPAGPTNRPPLAGTPFIKVIGDEVSEIPARRFVIWCSDPDNDPLSVTAVTSPSAMGAVVTFETNLVSYAPLLGFLGDDTFGYTINDGHGGFASGTASILVEPRRLAAATMRPPITSPGALQVNFTGFADLGYTVERAESLAGPWTPISNVLADDNGAASFIDRNPPAGSAFYRAVHY
jgi:uncharacterized repeat protein (TIGR03803 family)